ncbi:MAG: ABC transporter permease, partial [Gemmatimonadaceae bacterium]
RSARVLLRSPLFSLMALITLALGIGATTAIFTVLDVVVLRPLPYRDADRLVSILHPATVAGSGERKWGLSLGGYVDLKTKTKTLSDIGLYRTGESTITNDNRADAARTGRITASVLTTLKARAAFGRLITQSDDQPGAPPVAVLSREYFEKRFAGDASIIGRNLVTSDGNFEIVGVAEKGLTLPMPDPFASQANLAGFGVDVWLPLQASLNPPYYNNHPFVGIGRLKDGATVESAEREFTGLMSRWSELLPRVYSPGFIKGYNFRIEVSDLRNAVLGPSIPRTLWMVLGAVALVMLIAVANIANLFLVRMEARHRESAIRSALGASSRHMIVHYLSESLLLCLTAGVIGVALAFSGLRALLYIAPSNIPRLTAVHIQASSILVAFTIAMVMGVLLGIMPLLRKVSIAALREGGRGLSSSPRQRAIRNGLVIGQMALALVLLAAAGLMTKSFLQLRNVQPGFNATNITAFNISLPFMEYDTREKALAFHRDLYRTLSEMPGVASVGASEAMPLEDFGTGCSVVFRENEPYVKGVELTPCVSTPIAAPGFFETLHIKVDGRIPTWDDVDKRTQAVVVTRDLADRLWPGQNAIGKGINTNGDGWYRIVGVAEKLHAEALESAPTEAVFYAPTGFKENRRDDSLNELVFLVRTNGTPSPALSKQITNAVATLNPRVPVVNQRSMSHVVERSMARTSFVMTLLGVAAVVALLLSAVGMYGVISYVVAQRRAEIGIRIALGAGLAGVARLVMWQSLRLALIGVAIGVVGAWLLGRTMTSLLFGVAPNDPITLVGVSILLIVIAAAASLAPARRAARIDPLEAMRSD